MIIGQIINTIFSPPTYSRMKQIFQRNSYYLLKQLKIEPTEKIGKSIGEYTTLLSLTNSNIADSVSASQENNKDILFFVGSSGFLNLLSFELTLFKVLEKRGYTCDVIVCDQLLDLCEMMDVQQTDKMREELCRRCWQRGQDAFKAVSIPYLRASQLINQDIENQIHQLELSLANKSTVELQCLEINGIKIGSHALAATLRFLKRGDLITTQDETYPQHDILLRYVKSAIKNMLVAEAFLIKDRPDKVIMTHGIYVSWGPAREVFQREGIPVAVYDQSPIFHSAFVTSWNQPSQACDIRVPFEREKGEPLTNEERTKLLDYLTSRRQNSQDRTRFNIMPELSRSEVRRKLGVPSDSLCIGLFSNLLWDAATVGKDICFSRQMDWILDTIEYFVKHPEKWLLIRPHPAEELRGTQQSVIDSVRQVYPTLPTNIRVFQRSMEFNAYSVYSAIDSGLVNTSTVGLEMSLLGIPVITVSDAHYRNKGFTIDPSNQNEYLAALNSLKPENRLAKVQIAEAERYAYMYFFRHHIQFPFFKEDASKNIIINTSLNSDESELLKNLNDWLEAFEYEKPFVLERSIQETNELG